LLSQAVAGALSTPLPLSHLQLTDLATDL